MTLAMSRRYVLSFHVRTLVAVPQCSPADEKILPLQEQKRLSHWLVENKCRSERYTKDPLTFTCSQTVRDGEIVDSILLELMRFEARGAQSPKDRLGKCRTRLAKGQGLGYAWG